MGESSFEPVSDIAAQTVKTESLRLAKPLWIYRLRIEDIFALLAAGPIVFFTVKAYYFYRSQGSVPNLFLTDINRVLWFAVAIVVAHLILKYRPQLKLLRLILPLAYCLAIYTNLHDTIPFMNPRDIHYGLIRIDQWIFGVQPSVWAQQFIHPWLTETLSACYWSYFILIPLVAVVLYFQKRYPEAREVMVTTVLCLYAGYLLYVIFPAISPSVVLKDSYSVKLLGTPFTDATMGIAGMLPLNVRDAFPSMHAGIAFLTLLFAWKYIRLLFWIILPVCIGLVISTIYLRHHYFIDLPAGFIVGYLAFKYSGQVDAWWRARARDI